MLIFIVVQDTATFFSGLAGFVALVGIIASFKALISVKKEASHIIETESKLAPNESWLGAYQHDKSSLLNWFREQNIIHDSGVGDVLSACWAAFQGKRSVSLTEIHVLVARRERTKLAVKLSGGIIGLLLVIGIAGTLFSIHPVLSNFEFNISDPNGDEKLVNVVDSTEVVNSLMQNLGTAFLPSLFALCGTIIVATVRGLYSKALNSYALELDRFAIWTVIPRFRPSSISEEYEIVRASFDSLASAISSRDERFDLLLNNLSNFVSSTEKTLLGLEKSITRINGAAEALADRTGSIGESLMKTLGKKSPLLGVINGYEGIFQRTNKQIEALSESTLSFIKSSQKGAKAFEKNADNLAKLMHDVSVAQSEDRSTWGKLMSDIKDDRNEERAAFVAAAMQISSDRLSAGKSIDEALASLSQMSLTLPINLTEATKKCLIPEFEKMGEGLQEICTLSSDSIAASSASVTSLCSELSHTISNDIQALNTIVARLPEILETQFAGRDETLKGVFSDLNIISDHVELKPNLRHDANSLELTPDTEFSEGKNSIIKS